MKFVLEIPINGALQRPGGDADLDALADRLERVAEHLRVGRFLRRFVDAGGNRVEMRCELTEVSR